MATFQQSTPAFFRWLQNPAIDEYRKKYWTGRVGETPAPTQPTAPSPASIPPQAGGIQGFSGGNAPIDAMQAFRQQYFTGRQAIPTAPTEPVSTAPIGSQAAVEDQKNIQVWNAANMPKDYVFTNKDLENYAGQPSIVPQDTGGGYGDMAVPQPPTMPAMPDMSGIMGNLMGRLQEVQGRLSGKLRKSTRASLTAEAGQLMGVLGQIMGSQQQAATGMGRNLVDLYGQSFNAITAPAQAQHYRAQAGIAPTQAFENLSKGALNLQHMAAGPQNFDQTLQLEQTKNATTPKNIMPDIFKALSEGYAAAAVSPEGPEGYMKWMQQNFPQVFGMMGGAQQGAIPQAGAGATTQPPNAVRGFRNPKTGEVKWFDKDDKEIR